MEFDSRLTTEVSYVIDKDRDRKDVVLYSFLQKRVLKPRFQIRSSFLRKIWWLFLGKYFVSRKDINSSGIHRCYNAVIEVDFFGYTETKTDKIPDWVTPLCKDCFPSKNE